METLKTFLDSPGFLIGWACLMVPCVAVLWWDLRRQPIRSLMKAYPFNLLLLRFGVKDGMMDPREA